MLCFEEVVHDPARLSVTVTDGVEVDPPVLLLLDPPIELD
jgi:hypothetical protein